MTELERMEAAAIAGWLHGFAPCIWTLRALRSQAGAPLFDGAAAYDYETRVERLLQLLAKVER